MTYLNQGLQALGDPTRLAILRALAEGPLPVARLAEGFPISRPAISQHLRSLKQAGLITDRAQGRNVFYRCEPKGLAPLFDWMSHYDLFWRKRFANLRTLLKEIDP